VDQQVPILIGGTADAAIERVVRWGSGWTAGGSAPEQIGPLVERVRTAWAEAGRRGRPAIVALTYFSMQEDRAEESRANLRDYYEFLGEWAEGIAQGTPRGAEPSRMPPGGSKTSASTS
jgi:alkanesulfonate monooxygenase SsuD/methylene tetrahydromethanopterin reductase-like flavin-dependent oxidoreductase (luciferase family)